MRGFAGKLWEFARDSTPSRRRQRYGDVDFDWELRVDTTAATLSWRTRLLGALNSPYQATDAALFREMMDSLAIDFPQFTFIDLGSGKGRTLLMASDYPFRRILGVELLPELHVIAQQNIANYRNPGQKCFELQSVCGDALSFQFPAEPTVLYLFNPLPAAGLARVLANLEGSLRHSPRAFYVVYYYPVLDALVAHCSFLQRVGGTAQFSVYRAVDYF